MLVGRRMFDLFHDADAAREARRAPGAAALHPRDAAPAGKRPSGHRRRRRGGGRPRRWPPPRPAEVVERLDRDGLLPAILFIFSRAGCDAAVQQCLRGRAAADRLRRAGRDPPDRRGSAPRRSPARTCPCSATGSGSTGWSAAWPRTTPACCPPSRRSSRSCSSAGLVKAVFATETLALGINMPARCVVLERLVKFNGEAHVDLTAGGVHAAHRPGRAPRHRRRGPRRGGVDAGGRPAARGRAGVHPHLSAAVELPAVVQHGGQPGRHASARTGPASCWSRRSPSSRRTGRWSAWPGRCSATSRPSDVRPSRCAATTATSTSTSRLRMAIADRERTLARQGAAQRRAAAVESLERLRVGDVIRVPRGRRAGLAVVLDPAPAGSASRGRWCSPRTAGPAGSARRLHRAGRGAGPDPGAEALQPPLAGGPPGPGRHVCATPAWTGTAPARPVAARRPPTIDPGRAAYAAAPAPVPRLPRPGGARPLGRAAAPAASATPTRCGRRCRAYRLAGPHVRPGLRAAPRARLSDRRRRSDHRRRPDARPDLDRGRPAGRRVPAPRRLGRAVPGRAGRGGVDGGLRGAPRGRRAGLGAARRGRRRGRRDAQAVGRDRGRRGAARAAS